ncbi:MAG: DNA-binding response regulator [Cyanobacteria bacterium SW_9_44_58]|nr:MAG: DNA-binding response regulator [Cyanobacteria bacterium SW_9_44_58]
MQSLDIPKTSPSQQLTQFSRILVVEDEELIREMVVLSLQQEGCEVSIATDGRTASNLLQNAESNQSEFPYDLIVLDLMLPQINGLDICRWLRYQGSTIPVLILSAKASETDRVLGLEVGADDYITKPFSMPEFVARCRALLRRQRFSSQFQSPVLQYQDLTLFPQQCRVTIRGEEISLSPKEFKLLELFIGSPGRVWSREQLIEQVWGPDFLGDTKTVDVHIRWLREKLEPDPCNPSYIVTVRGFGYRFG